MPEDPGVAPVRLSFLKRLIPVKAHASVNLDKPVFAEGEPVVGKFNVDAEEYVQSNEVRIEARVFERYEEVEWVIENNQRVPRQVQKENTLFSQNTPLSGPSDFGQGPTRAFPFSVGIPAYKPQHVGGSIEYSVKGVVAVKGRPDITHSTQIAFGPPQAYNVMTVPPTQQGGYSPQPGYSQQPTYAPAPAQPRAQIRCSYCQALIDQGTAFCPNCGGHL
jgi:hypothetical protein